MQPFVPSLIQGQSHRSPSHKIKPSFSKQNANSHFNTRATLRELLCTWVLRPLLPLLKCLSTSLSQKTHVRTSRPMLHRHARYYNPCRKRIKPSKRLILIKVVTKERAWGGKLQGAAVGKGLAVRGRRCGVRSAAGAEESSQAAQMSPAEGGKRLQGRSRASRLALSEGKVPGCFSAMLPPSQAGPARGRGHKETGETSRSLSPSKPSARQVMLLTNKIKVPLKKKKTTCKSSHKIIL